MEHFKTKYKWQDVESGDIFPADDAKVFINRVKSKLIGKELKQILIHSFYHCGGEKCNDTETYIEWSKNSSNYVEWDSPLILCIGDEHLEINLWQPERYRLGFNLEVINEIVDTNAVPFASIWEKYEAGSTTFYDISALYKDNLIGQKIKDIQIITEYEENPVPEEEYLVSINITLENGVVFKIYDEIDSPTIEIIEDGLAK